MSLDPALLERCVRAYVGMALRPRGHSYDGPCPDEILMDAGLREPTVEHHRACSEIVVEGERRIAAGEIEIAQVETEFPCQHCGRVFRSRQGRGNHSVRCDGGAKLRAARELAEAGMDAAHVARTLGISRSHAYSLMSGPPRYEPAEEVA